jgi:phospholipase C
VTGRFLSAAALLAALLMPPATIAPANQAAASVPPPHVMVIVEENRAEQAVIGSPSAPFINSLAARYGLATQSYAASHPSLPNYLDLIAGSTLGINDDGTGYTFAVPTLVDQLTQRGVGWRVYMEGMPSPCFGGAFSGGYAKKHDPFMYFSSVTASAGQCHRVVPFSQLAGDLGSGSAPPFLWVTPNLCDDGHDCGNSTMDAWLQATLTGVRTSAWYAHGGTVIITWDEGSDSAGCCGGAHGGHIATIVVAMGNVTSARSNLPVDHAGTLRTIEQIYGLPYLGAAACTCSGNLNALLGNATPINGLTWATVPHWR